MLGIEVGFYFLGFVSCLLILTIISIVVEKEKENKRNLRRQSKTSDKIETVVDRADINIDVDIM